MEQWLPTGPWRYGHMPREGARIVLSREGQYLADFAPHEPIPSRFINGRGGYCEGIKAMMMRTDHIPGVTKMVDRG